jgi:hypothetical protein
MSARAAAARLLIVAATADAAGFAYNWCEERNRSQASGSPNVVDGRGDCQEARDDDGDERPGCPIRPEKMTRIASHEWPNAGANGEFSFG